MTLTYPSIMPNFKRSMKKYTIDCFWPLQTKLSETEIIVLHSIEFIQHNFRYIKDFFQHNFGYIKVDISKHNGV